jgi:hypothetical protein
MVDGEPKPVYELWLQHGQDLIRNKAYSTREAAFAASMVWQREMSVARTAATALSTPSSGG